MQTTPAPARQIVQTRLWRAMAALLVAAILLGGKAAGGALRELVIQLLAVGVAVLVVPAFTGRLSSLERPAFWLILAMLVLFVLHLVPLPYGIWAAVHPVETADVVLRGLGMDRDWRPFTLVPHEGLDNLLLLLPPIAAYFAALRLNERYQAYLIVTIVSLAALSALLGFLQFASGTEALRFHTEFHQGYAIGFFANRNHQADLLLIGWLLSAGLLRSRFASDLGIGTGTRRILFWALSLFFLLAVLATGSRGGFLLAGFAGLAILLSGGIKEKSKALSGLAVGGIAATILFAVTTLTNNRLLGATVSRFEADDDARFGIWPETVRMIGDTMPLGSGVGSFVDYYKFAEPLENVGRKFVNAAHNDYLEILLETGVPGLALLLTGLVILALGAHRTIRGPVGIAGGANEIRVMAVFAIIVLLAHSAIDYPLRTTGLAVVFGALCGLILREHDNSTVRRRAG